MRLLYDERDIIKILVVNSHFCAFHGQDLMRHDFSSRTAFIETFEPISHYAVSRPHSSIKCSPGRCCFTNKARPTRLHFPCHLQYSIISIHFHIIIDECTGICAWN